jgi:hypothetical protein
MEQTPLGGVNYRHFGLPASGECNPLFYRFQYRLILSVILLKINGVAGPMTVVLRVQFSPLPSDLAILLIIITLHCSVIVPLSIRSILDVE